MVGDEKVDSLMMVVKCCRRLVSPCNMKTFRRGHLIVDDGEFLAEEGSGRFLRRERVKL